MTRKEEGKKKGIFGEGRLDLVYREDISRLLEYVEKGFRFTILLTSN